MAIVGVTSFGSDGGPNDAGSSWFGQNTEYPAAAYGNFGPGNVGFLLNVAGIKDGVFYSTCQEQLRELLALINRPGTDKHWPANGMLFEQIPKYLEFFGFPSTTPEHLRQIARLDR